MANHPFWQDFFNTYKSLSDALQILWLIVPPAFILALTALFLHHRRAAKHRPNLAKAEPQTYTVLYDEKGILRVFAHGNDDRSEEDGEHAPLVLKRLS